jgi:hypothetical protein
VAAIDQSGLSEKEKFYVTKLKDEVPVNGNGKNVEKRLYNTKTKEQKRKLNKNETCKTKMYFSFNFK